MSADNYMLIRKVLDRYVVSRESASSDTPTTIEEALGRRLTKAFATLHEANLYANSEYTKYGVRYDFPVKIVEA